MRAIKSTALSILMQAVILLLHVFLHMARLYELSDQIGHIEEICSFIIVILTTFLAYLLLDLPAYTLISANLVTFLFLMISDEPGTYLFYYVLKGSSPFFNPPIFTDAVIVTVEMLFFQLITMALAKLTRYRFVDRKAITETNSLSEEISDGE